MDKHELVRLALEARARSYSPYSNFQVGAALLADGKVFQGCNVENASYGAAICAERNAALQAVYDGKRKFEAIAVAGYAKDAAPDEIGYAFPCGICRQFLREFAVAGMKVYVAKSLDDIYETTLEALLPDSFGPEDLGK